MRPEIPGLILGVLVISLIRKEFVVKGGSAPLTRFVLGICLMIGAFIFIGCPTTMLLRLARGDLNALVGLFGFAGGVVAGMFALNKGFSLGRAYTTKKSDGFVFPAIGILLLVALVFFPAILNFSEQGFASFHAPIIVSLIGGMLVGGIAFVSRICTVAVIRDSIFFKSFGMLAMFGVLMLVLVGYNLIFGHFSLGMESAPFAHTDGIWNFLGLALVGFVSVLIGGCPFRQLVLAGSGNSDSAITVIGMMVGAVVAHNFSIASSGAGVTDNAPIAFVIATVVAVAIALYNIISNKKERSK
ncbi:MAG: YedE family putative selenium transporter [Defluviitaleaceae bacterium]|nr:YedE family putative selenium transporter [Defluviitaleaceae bacterium]